MPTLRSNLEKALKSSLLYCHFGGAGGVPPRHRTPRSGPLSEDHEAWSESLLDLLRSLRSCLAVSCKSSSSPSSVFSPLRLSFAVACFFALRCLRLNLPGAGRSMCRGVSPPQRAARCHKSDQSHSAHRTSYPSFYPNGSHRSDTPCTSKEVLRQTVRQRSLVLWLLCCVVQLWQENSESQETLQGKVWKASSRMSRVHEDLLLEHRSCRSRRQRVRPHLLEDPRSCCRAYR